MRSWLYWCARILVTMDAEAIKRRKREASQRWRDRHPGQNAAYQRKWRAEHHGAAAAYQRKWQERHPGADAVKQRKWRERHPGVAAAYQRNRRAEHPEAVAAIKARFKARHPDKNYYDYDKQMERQARWHARHPDWVHPPDKRKISNDRWRAKHPEEIKAKDARSRALRSPALEVGKVTPEDWKGICESYGNACAYCDATDKKLGMDHVIPLSKGGAHSVENLVPACRSCNSRKSARLIKLGAFRKAV